MADKLPYLQLYLADWIRDTRMLTLETRAIWVDLLTLMHDSVRRGHLLSRSGVPFSPEQLAAYCACSRETVNQAIQELKTSGVASCTESGVLYSRRMVKDERKRQLARQAGKKGGNPALKRGRPPPDNREVNSTLKGQDNQPLIMECSNGISPKEGGAGGENAPTGNRGRAVDNLDPFFDRFWRAYPLQVAEYDARRAWDEIGVDAALLEEILRAIDAQKRSQKWISGKIRNPANWLRGGCWKDTVQAASTSDTETAQQRAERQRRQKEALKIDGPAVPVSEVLKRVKEKERTNDDPPRNP